VWLVMQVLKFTALSADLRSEEPIDVVCHESYPQNATLWDNYSLVKFVPFNPVDKFTMAIVKENSTGHVFRVMKGAPQVCHVVMF
jgi:H+-transporting ATPase